MKRVERSHLVVVALTDEGARGKKNEDRYGVSAFQRKDRRKTPVLLAVLADGIGGHRAGEVAADLAVDRISAHVAAAPEDQPPAELLREAVRTASQTIYQHASAAPERQGMGATCAVAYVVGTRLFAANVGDSRIYLLRRGQLHRLSIDHTWIQEALDHGVLKEEEIRGHPNAHIIRRFLGSAQPPEAALRLQLEAGSDGSVGEGISLQKDDILLLCSDGLTDLVSDEEIAKILAAQPLENAADRLIDLANQRGGHDNITLILMRVPEKAVNENGRPRGIWLAGCFSLIVIAALAAVGLYGTDWFDQPEEATPTITLEWTLLPLASSGMNQTMPAATVQPPAANPLPDQQASPTQSIFDLYPTGATITPWPTHTLSPASVYP